MKSAERTASLILIRPQQVPEQVQTASQGGMAHRHFGDEFLCLLVDIETRLGQPKSTNEVVRCATMDQGNKRMHCIYFFLPWIARPRRPVVLVC